jgi:aryl-alcohol dehydrogenase-like predicted oxidoreductase
MMDGMAFKGVDSSAEYCKKECEKSLEKLGVECIDLCKCLPQKQYHVH